MTGHYKTFFNININIKKLTAICIPTGRGKKGVEKLRGREEVGIGRGRDEKGVNLRFWTEYLLLSIQSISQ